MFTGRSSSHKLLQSAWRFAQTRERHKFAVVLKQDVPTLGVEGDQVVVTPGYVRNYLYPQKMAIYAPWSNKPTAKRISDEVKQESPGTQAAPVGIDSSLKKMKGSPVRNQLKHVLKRLSRAPVVMHVDIGTENQLQRPLHEEDVIKHVARTMGIRMPAGFMNIPEPLMKAGTHIIKLRIALDRRESLALTLKLLPPEPELPQKVAKSG
ncbi:hypothetical protein BSKO_07534 [Bryopsis sp. KO-2023]|nr:hypothetical protein BSKO_07534 [Bryopsis sp. KO-2023]